MGVFWFKMCKSCTFSILEDYEWTDVDDLSIPNVHYGKGKIGNCTHTFQIGN